MGVRHKTVSEALAYVSKNPVPTADPIAMPVWELVARQLYDRAANVGGTARQIKATNQAHKIIADRTIGRRKAGTAPAQKVEHRVVIADFTKKELPSDGD